MNQQPIQRKFHGGLRLAMHKAESADKAIVEAPVPSELVLPCTQHVGEPAIPVVRVGERVLRGQVIACAAGFVSAPVHASSSGIVTAIEPRPVAQLSMSPQLCIVIRTDGEDAALDPLPPIPDYRYRHPSEIRNRIRQAGIVGLGGAVFPAASKLTTSSNRPIDTLILNGIECEPYITCDDRLMREHADDIVQGLLILRHLLGAQRCLIGIEEDMRQAIAALGHALEHAQVKDAQVIRVPTIYPAGAEGQLIELLTGREVPSGGLPADIGIVCQNVATAAAIYRAVALGEPLTSRIVTLTGKDVAQACNLRVRLGTPFQTILDFCGLTLSGRKLIMGGPMMGLPILDTGVPVVKATNCLLLMPDEPPRGIELPCIRCGACMDVCPARLLPQQLYWHARGLNLEGLRSENLFDCIECGCCALVCPSQIPLVSYYQQAKTAVEIDERQQERARQAGLRHRQHESRLSQPAPPRQQAAEAVPTSAPPADKQAAIQDALQRVRARKAQRQTPVRPVPLDAAAAEDEPKDADGR